MCFKLYSKACELAKNVKITSRLEELKNELKERNMVTVEITLQELAKIRFADIKSFPKHIHARNNYGMGETLCSKVLLISLNKRLS